MDVLLIHHSHTDVGFTARQGKVVRDHIEFIDQAIDIARRLREGDETLQGFCWTSECFWSIEQWLEARPKERHAELVQAIRDGVIALSATYLHFNELPDAELMRHGLMRARDFADQFGLLMDGAISADINGFGWGYSQALHNAGIRNFATCVHADHGTAPIGQRQSPFFWETPQGDEILVWNGEHYTLGNVLGLSPGAGLNYGFRDEMYVLHREMDTLPVARKRLGRYIRQIKKDGYPYDFVPIHVAGATSDNAPPSEAIARFCHDWNATHGGEIRLVMAAPDEIFRRVREVSLPIPRYRGDWPDWWSDGLASVPAEVRLAREAMRTLRWLKEWDPDAVSPQAEREVSQNLLLFFEHTYHHAGSLKTPFDLEVQSVGSYKKFFAVAAFDTTMNLKDDALRRHGGLPPIAPSAAGDRFLYKVINPFPMPATDVAVLYLDTVDENTLFFDARVVNPASGTPLPFRKSRAARGLNFEVPVTLAALGELRLEIVEGPLTLVSKERDLTDQAFLDPPPESDVEGAEAPREIPANRIETPYFEMELSQEAGIQELRERNTGMSLLSTNRAHPPFTPIHEITPSPGRESGDMRQRGVPGRNRKGSNVERNAGQLIDLDIAAPNALGTQVKMRFSLPGTDSLHVQLLLWQHAPRIDAVVRILKAANWQSENMYLSLPFMLPGAQLWLDKAGAAMRPWQDQLPDSLTDWFLIQAGWAYCGSKAGLCIASPDSPLLQLGPLEFGKRRLMGHPRLNPADSRPYAWLMTNHWAVNFHPLLAGFHEFRYRIEMGAHLSDPDHALAHCRSLNAGLQTFRIIPN